MIESGLHKRTESRQLIYMELGRRKVLDRNSIQYAESDGDSKTGDLNFMRQIIICISVNFF